MPTLPSHGVVGGDGITLGEWEEGCPGFDELLRFIERDARLNGLCKAGNGRKSEYCCNNDPEKRDARLVLHGCSRR